MGIKRIFVVALLFILIFKNVDGQKVSALDRFIMDAMSNHHMHGLSAAVVKDGKIIWAKGYGFANIEKNIPYTPYTINAEIASISKTITATAIMQLWEQNKFKLDDPINNFLPFTVVNPYFPDYPITFRMLLCHSSSMDANYDIGMDKFNFNDVHFPKLGKFVYELVNPGGAYYRDSVCFKNFKPGTKWNYSGTGYALLGYLVEIISKMPFDKYCEQNIFIPLGMNHTSWHFSGVDTNMVSRPYQWSDEANDYVDCGLYEYPTYPEGQLKSTVMDLSKFLWMNMNNGVVDGKRILRNSSLKLMHSNQVIISDTNFKNLSTEVLSQVDASYGLGWGHIKINHHDYWGHHGRNVGISTEIGFDADKNIGVILLTNGEDDASALIPCSNKDDIVCKLMDVADNMDTTGSIVIHTSPFQQPRVHDYFFWKNNTNQWPLNAFPMKLGTEYFYDKDQTQALMEANDFSDASVVLVHQLIATKLNIANGSDFSSVVNKLNNVNTLLGKRKLPVRPIISSELKEGIQMIDFTKELEVYNVGLVKEAKK